MSTTRLCRPAPRQIPFGQARLVADAFLDAPRTAPGPIVLAAYRALAAQVDERFARLTSDRSAHPVRVVFTRQHEPYWTASELAEQVRVDGVLEICPALYDRDRRHPLLDSSIGGSHDRFRAVHDVVSHAWWGNGFDRDGEFSAWIGEDCMYHGLARWALATELHAQHSVRWTTGDVAEHKACLLDTRVLERSRRRAGPPTGA